MSTIVSSLCVLFLVILSIPVESRIDISKCGEVKLRSEKVVNFGTVEIEYHPSKDEKSNNNSKRHWIYSAKLNSKTLKMATGMHEQIRETNDVYVLKIYRFNSSMNGRYAVYCGDSKTFTNPIEVKVSEPPSLPVILGLQNIENCTDCIVGEDNEKFELACEIHGGSRPLIVTMTIGNASYIPLEWNSTTYMVLFYVRDHHHMENVIFSVMNDALSSPLSVTAKMFVITYPDGKEKSDNIITTANQDGIKTGDNMSTTGSKPQHTVSRDIELTGPPTALDAYEQLQNRTDTEIRGTYDSLEVNSRVQQNSQSQYESLNQEAEKYHTYTDLKQSR